MRTIRRMIQTVINNDRMGPGPAYRRDYARSAWFLHEEQGAACAAL